jgi:LysR family transcriptional regulator, hydrogen peroxide-inducible genes activator
VELHQLRYFSAVAETGSFTKGALREHVSQPSLSQQISKLEGEVGTELFVRLGHATKLTPAGKVLLPKAKSILNQIGQAVNEMQIVAKVETGSVTIGTVSTAGPYLLPKVMQSFRRKHPWVHLQVVEGRPPELLVLLRNAEADMVIVQHPVQGKEFLSEILIQDLCYLVCPYDHRLSNRKAVSLQEVGKEPLVMLGGGFGFRKSLLAALRNARIQPNIVYEALDFCTVTAMVAAGMGISVIPEMAIERRKECAFVPVKDGSVLLYKVGLARLKRNHLSPAQLQFAQELKDSLSTRNLTKSYSLRRGC